MKVKEILKVTIIIIVVIAMALIGITIYNSITNKDGSSRVTNDFAESDDENRYLTIINDTGQIINEVHITVGEGTEIEHGFQYNPDETSFSVKIPKAYEEYDSFTVILIDRYGIKYEKTISDVSDKGRTEIKISESNYIEQSGDWKKKIDRWFNND